MDNLPHGGQTRRVHVRSVALLLLHRGSSSSSLGDRSTAAHLGMGAGAHGGRRAGDGSAPRREAVAVEDEAPDLL